MTLSDPYPITTPAEVAPVGRGPFWQPGDIVTWTFRRFDFDRDLAEVTRPMRVITDGPDGAALWLAGGARTGETRIVGWEGTDPHDVPLRARFRPLAEAPTRIRVDGAWRGRGVLKIVPAEVPFSVWVLLKDDAPGPSGPGGPSGPSGAGARPSGVRAEWYVNLEATHRRTRDALFTSDHILDITFPVPTLPLHAADGGLDASGAVFKDVDELAAAANFGAWPVEWSETIRANGAHLLEHLDDYSWAFDPAWETTARALADEAPPDTAQPEEAQGDREAPASVRQEAQNSGHREHRSIPSGCYDRQFR
ncbi:DUF402 domain-containing protein [Brevibacterium sp. SMBL_HHYL_HB1]|uniref:DUF402 domain-containing protein n=1 Tax=Brevibacterium sp. SMBL_HHYL_HB1 TaxID=2777556 RepID=UPI001BA61FBF|nr:DUF402 domain-containing protein [Brevibacterium sp. SMBL_HHYL_HB1]QUL79230.1 DUF402 domain-containing protein [Brevibacterium sp. SMBL_HHYL_HB1]